MNQRKVPPRIIVFVDLHQIARFTNFRGNPLCRVSLFRAPALLFARVPPLCVLEIVITNAERSRDSDYYHARGELG